MFWNRSNLLNLKRALIRAFRLNFFLTVFWRKFSSFDTCLPKQLNFGLDFYRNQLSFDFLFSAYTNDSPFDSFKI